MGNPKKDETGSAWFLLNCDASDQYNKPLILLSSFRVWCWSGKKREKEGEEEGKRREDQPLIMDNELLGDGMYSFTRKPHHYP